MHRPLEGTMSCKPPCHTVCCRVTRIYVLQIGFRNPEAIPEPHSILFRYDPPVLIVYVRWHETERSFGKLVRDYLYLNYAGNESSVSDTHPSTS